MGISLTLLPAIVNLFLLFGLLCSVSISQLLTCLTVTCFVLFGYCLLDSCSFVGNGGGVDLAEKGGRGARRNEGRENCSGYNCVKEESNFN